MVISGSNKNRFHIKFQITLVTLIVIVLCLSSFSILFAVLSISKTVSTRKASQLFAETGHRVEAQLSQQLNRAVQLSHLFSTLPQLSEPIEGDATASSLLSFMGKALKSYPNLYSLYTGNRDGQFLQFIHVAGDANIKKVHQAPENTAFILRSISFLPDSPDLDTADARKNMPAKMEYWTFYDDQMQRVGSRKQAHPDYNPAKRIWFSKADAAGDQVTLTEPYLFNSLKAPGITASVKAMDDCIIGVDITLKNLKTFLENIHISPGTGLMIIDEKDRILAATGRMEKRLGIENASLKKVSSMNTGQTAPAFNQDTTSPTSLLVTEKGDMIWNNRWKNIGGINYRLIIITPISDFTAHLIEMKKRIIVATLCLIALIFPFAVIGSRRLSRFLEILAIDAGRIEKFDFEHDTPEHSLILEFEQLANAFRLMKQTVSERTKALETTMEKLKRIIELGITMSVERDSDRLVELILKGAKELSNADGGSLYLKSDDDILDFKIVLTDSNGIAQGGTSGLPVTLPSVPLYDENGESNHRNVVSYAVLTGQTIAIGDVYKEKHFQFTGTREFDEMNNYKSRSFLTVPLKVQGSEVIGALQLINSISPETGEIVPFSPEIQGLVEALSAEAAAVLHKRDLHEAQKQLFESLIRLIADAIDIKSPYTGRHCARVPQLALMLAQEVEKCDHGTLADFCFDSDDDRRAFEIGAWLHDAGKMTTPEFVVDKAVKLETIYNRIHEIRTRFEVVLRDVRLEEKQTLLQGGDPKAAREVREEKETQLKEEFALVARCNIGSEKMADGAEDKLRQIARRTWISHFNKSLGLSIEEKERFDRAYASLVPVTETLLADKPEHIIPFSTHPREVYRECNFNIPETDCLYNRGELYNLSVSSGTLTTEERFKINEHIMQTSIMLNHLPFPKPLKKVPEYAVTHHETLNGTGYPCGLSGSQLSVPSRIMAIADIFEALTASDRPYKKAKKLSRAIAVLHQFKKNRHIDPDLFDLFLTSGVYLKYAQKFLPREQIDEVDIRQFLG